MSQGDPVEKVSAHPASPGCVETKKTPAGALLCRQGASGSTGHLAQATALLHGLPEVSDAEVEHRFGSVARGLVYLVVTQPLAIIVAVVAAV